MYQLGAGEYNTVQTGRTGHIYLIHFILWSFMFSVTCKNYHNLNGQHINILVGSQRSVRLYSGVVKAKNIFYFQYKQRVKNAGTLSTCKASAKYKLYLRDSYVVVVVGSRQSVLCSEWCPSSDPPCQVLAASLRWGPDWPWPCCSLLPGCDVTGLVLCRLSRPHNQLLLWPCKILTKNFILK